jgi:hypothetical protein
MAAACSIEPTSFHQNAGNGPGFVSRAESDIPYAVSMDTNSDYDAIGRGYSLSRMTDPRIAREIVQALGDNGGERWCWYWLV